MGDEIKDDEIIEEESLEPATDDVPSDEVEEKKEELTPSDEDVPDTTDGPPKKGGVEKKIGKLTKRAALAEQEAAYWKGVAEGKTQQQPPVKEEPIKPTPLDPADFGTYEDYLDAREVKIREQVRAEVLNEQKKKEKDQTIQIVQAQCVKAREKYEDFDAVALNPRLPINQMIVDVAMGENFAKILYALGKDPEKAAQIAMMKSPSTSSPAASTASTRSPSPSKARPRS